MEESQSIDSAEYWRSQITPLIHFMLQSSGKYPSSSITSHTSFINNHLIPHLGPRPSLSPISFFAKRRAVHGYHNSPLEASFSFSSSFKSHENSTETNPTVRFAIKPVGPLGGTPIDFLSQSAARYAFTSLASATPGADFTWVRAFQDSLFLHLEELDAVRESLGSITICPWSIGFDLRPDGRRDMKAYFSPILKARATGRSGLETALETVEQLSVPADVVGFRPAVAVLRDFLLSNVVSSPSPQCVLVGMDCSSPLAAAPRVKLYLLVPGTCFATAREMVTLGGRLPDDGLDSLRSCWHLLLDEPDQPLVDEEWSKPSNDAGDAMTGLMYSVEMTATEKSPRVKVYVPVYQYARSGRAAVANVGKVLERLGCRWDGWEGFWTEEVVEERFQQLVSVAVAFDDRDGKVKVTIYFTRPVFDD